VADIARHVQGTVIAPSISASTIWRWLHEDAIRPWQHRCWIFPRDPNFQQKASRASPHPSPIRRIDVILSADARDLPSADCVSCDCR
jgi:hypothetical protein